ncbi:MAG: hypothetical protein OEV60_08295 [Actinomycetota bacterium]|nr:hypothetical protein [Actinomycetota bacterium]MDH5224992.1 hypothetical protein [Actinomycetota bacterium]MDH5314368.1 hypothetical protein [Actinomycetota bacterium]
MSVHVRTAGGATYDVDVESAADFEGIREQLVTLGVPLARVIDTLIISDDVLEGPLDTAVDWPDPTTPPIPTPPNADTLPPGRSPSILVASADLEEPYLQFGDDEGDFVALSQLREWSLAPAFPKAQMRYKRYWLNTGSYRIRGPQEFSKTVTTTEGMSETQSTALSGELGLGVGKEGVANLGLKLSATFQRSFTVSSERTVSETYNLTIPEGKIAVYTIWQLVNEVVIVDPAGSELDYEGKVRIGFVPIPVRWVVSVASEATPGYALDPIMFDSA